MPRKRAGPPSAAEPLNAGSETRASNIEAALFLVLASAFFAATAALVKATAQAGVDVFQLLFLRAAIGLLVLAPLLRLSSTAPWRSSHLKLHLARSATGGVAVVIGFHAFALVPLATATAIHFTMPLFVTILAAVLLKEAVGWRRWAATLAGFAGVLAMARPGAADFDPIALIVLIQAACIAWSVTVIKRFPVRESQLSMMFFTFVSSGLIAVAPALHAWVWPRWDQAGLILAISLVGLVAQACVLRAYRRGQASYLAPVSYVRLIFAGALGMIFFDEYPAPTAWLGALVIAVSGLYTVRRAEVRRRAG